MTYDEWRSFARWRAFTFLLVALACAVLAGCAQPAGAPASASASTASMAHAPTSDGPAASPAPAPLTIDAKGMVGAEVAYQVTRIGLEAAIDLGELRGTKAQVSADLEGKAFVTLTVARSAWDLHQLLVASGAVPGVVAGDALLAQLAALRRDNDLGHGRLQAKLAPLASPSLSPPVSP